MAETTPGEAPAAPVKGDIKRYPVLQPDGSTRHQLIQVTQVTEEGRVHGVPLAWEDQHAEFAPGMLVD